MSKLKLAALLLGAALFSGIGAVSLSAEGMKCGSGKCGASTPTKMATCDCDEKCDDAKTCDHGKNCDAKGCAHDKKSSMKCGSGKCGGEKKAPAMKCGSGKCQG